MADDLMDGYRRIVSMAPRAGRDMAGVPDQACHRSRCTEPVAYRVKGKALCDGHARQQVTKLKSKGKK